MSSGRRLPRGWHTMRSRTTGGVYYFNRYTQATQWHRPTERSRHMPRRDDTRSRSQSRSRSHTPEEILKCSHILIKHKDSRRPTDWRDKPVTRTKDQAKKLAVELREKILKKQAAFDELARAFSECSSARRRGNLGTFRRGHMQEAFEDVAFGLEVGQVSEIVESNSGFHIIRRHD